MAQYILGIDIAKATVQVTLCLTKRRLRATFANTQDGHTALLAWLKKHHAPTVHACLEATGRYGDALALALHEAGHLVSVVNPVQIHAYAKSQLRRSKTDALDADLLADYASTHPPEAWTPPPPEIRALQALVRHLDALQRARTQERNRLQAEPPSQDVQRLLEAHIRFLDDQIAQVQRAIREHLDQHPGLREQRDLLTSIPGIGDTLAAWLLSVRLDQFASAKAVAAYAGLCPQLKQSGTSVRGPARLSKCGAADLRKALYMPALCAARFNPPLEAFATRLRAQGKAKMVVVAAVMRKLLCLAYGVLKSKRPFDPDFRPQGA